MIMWWWDSKHAVPSMCYHSASTIRRGDFCVASLFFAAYNSRPSTRELQSSPASFPQPLFKWIAHTKATRKLQILYHRDTNYQNVSILKIKTYNSKYITLTSVKIYEIIFNLQITNYLIIGLFSWQLIKRRSIPPEQQCPVSFLSFFFS